MRATPKDRRWVTLRDAQSGDRAVRLRWRKRIWECGDEDCEVCTWTEQTLLAEPRCSPPEPASGPATEWLPSKVPRASIARGFGCRVKAVAAGIRRVHGTAVDQAAPVTVANLRRMLEVAPPGLAGTRDRALLLTAFAGALRRSEIVALQAEVGMTV